MLEVLNPSSELIAGWKVIDDTIQTYKPPARWIGLNRKHQRKLANLLLNAKIEQRAPVMVHATVWFSPGKSISDLTEYLGKWVKANPVKNGIRQNANGVTQKYRVRPRCLFAWKREQKDTSAPDCLHESGLHAHVVLIYDSHSFQKKTWPYFMMEQLQRVGIIAPHPEHSNTSWFVTGFHDLKTPADIEDAFKHSLYLAKIDQEVETVGSRNFGTNLGLIDIHKQFKQHYKEKQQ